MNYILIPAEQLHSVWDYVKPGLERVLEVSDGAVPWIPEDVYAALKFKCASLYIGEHEGKRRGFFVLEVRFAPHSGERQLHIWVVYGAPVKGDHYADAMQFLNETMEYLDACKESNKCEAITIDGRWGWTKALGGMFKPTLARYERRTSTKAVVPLTIVKEGVQP